MKRSGGKSGRPMGHISIDMIESHVTEHQSDLDELLIVQSELQHRNSKRAMQLKSLVERLIGDANIVDRRDIGPLFD